MERKMEFEKKRKDGKVAVLVSGGYGAGWSTWANDHSDFLAFDAGLVDMAERKATIPEVEAYLKSQLGDDYYVYMGGWGDVEVEWLEEGTPFYIHEYDGSESLRTGADLVMTA